MTAHDYRILIGASGWQYPAWQTVFYPDDLPEDWQLGYYSNEFPVVLLPGADWQRFKGDIEVWLEDCNDELGIICELPQELLQLHGEEVASAINGFIAGLSILKSHCIGLVLPVNHFNHDIESLLVNINSPVPVCVEVGEAVSADEFKAIQKLCEKHQTGFCWHGEGDASGLTMGQLALSRINARGMSMRQLREVVETILNTTKLEQTCVLIIDGDPPDLEAMRNANVILDLF